MTATLPGVPSIFTRPASSTSAIVLSLGSYRAVWVMSSLVPSE